MSKRNGLLRRRCWLISTPVVTNAPESKSKLALEELLVLFAATITTVSMLAWLLWRCNFGFDFTDESFYLNWISNPYLYKVSASQFGFVYHPLYLFVRGDIALLRQSNILITFGLAFILCIFLLRSTYRVRNQNSSLSWKDPRQHVISAVLASISLMSLTFSGYWMSTPGYNTLAFQALLVAGIGLLLAQKSLGNGSIAGWVLIGIAGWLAFMAKPTTALALAIAVSGYLFLARKMSIRNLVIAIATAATLLLISAWAIDGSILVFIKRLNDAAEFVKILGGGHTLSGSFHWDSFDLDRDHKFALALATLAVFVVGFLFAAERRAIQMLGAAAAISIAALVLAVVCGLFNVSVPRDQFQGLQVWAAPIGGFLTATVILRAKILSAIGREELVLAICFLVFPHVYAFGTGNNYWVGASGAGYFWVISGMALLYGFLATNIAWRTMLMTAICAQAIVAVLVYIAMENPYRQTQPLRLNSSALEIGASRSRLVLSQDFFEYFNELERVAATSGYKGGTPLVDLTGHYPGALFFLGAKVIGQAWTIGGYPGSEKLAALALDRVHCRELSEAWVLAEPSGPRKLSDQILGRYGLDLQKDYVQVGRLHTPKGDYPDSYEQILYRPARPISLTSYFCRQGI